MKYQLKAKHPFLPDINQSFDAEEDRTNLINDITKEGYEVETSNAIEWEEFQIEITTPGSETGAQSLEHEKERSEITERFESELYRLVQKYQGQAGLTFYARNSDGEITEY